MTSCCIRRRLGAKRKHYEVDTKLQLRGMVEGHSRTAERMMEKSKQHYQVSKDKRYCEKAGRGMDAQANRKGETMAHVESVLARARWQRNLVTDSQRPVRLLKEGWNPHDSPP